MATRAVGEQAHLVFLEPVFHFSTGAVDVLVKSMWRVAQVGQDEARVGALSVMLSLDDDAPMARPGAGAIAEFVEQTLRYAASGKAPGGPLAQGGRVRQKARVLAHADHIMDMILLAPG